MRQLYSSEDLSSIPLRIIIQSLEDKLTCLEQIRANNLSMTVASEKETNWNCAKVQESIEQLRGVISVVQTYYKHCVDVSFTPFSKK